MENARIVSKIIRVQDFFPEAEIVWKSRYGVNVYRYPQNELPYLFEVIYSDHLAEVSLAYEITIDLDESSRCQVTFKHESKPRPVFLPSAEAIKKIKLACSQRGVQDESSPLEHVKLCHESVGD